MAEIDHDAAVRQVRGLIEWLLRQKNLEYGYLRGINPSIRYVCDLAERAKRLEEALRWYEERVSRFDDKTKSPDYLQAVSHELVLDSGKRARAALASKDKP